MKTKNKKGISPLIATVLVIGFTIVLAAMVITWGTKLFKTTTEETGKTSQFNLLCTTGYNLEYSTAKNPITVLAKNKNEKNINGFFFVLSASDGSTTQTFTTDNDPNLGVTTTTNARLTDSVNPLDGVGPFGTNKYTFTPAAAAQGIVWTSIDIRPIAKLDSGEKKVCDNEQNVKI